MIPERRAAAQPPRFSTKVPRPRANAQLAAVVCLGLRSCGGQCEAALARTNNDCDRASALVHRVVNDTVRDHYNDPDATKLTSGQIFGPRSNDLASGSTYARPNILT